MDIKEELKTKAIEYLEDIEELDNKVPRLLVDFVIEKYTEHRNYPKHFTDEMIEKDMTEHLSIMAMAVVDILFKVGTEGQKSHSENGVTMIYENAYISLSIFENVSSFVRPIE